PRPTLFPYTTLFRSAVGFSQGGPFALGLAAENLVEAVALVSAQDDLGHDAIHALLPAQVAGMVDAARVDPEAFEAEMAGIATDEDRKSTRLNSSHVK